MDTALLAAYIQLKATEKDVLKAIRSTPFHPDMIQAGSHSIMAFHPDIFMKGTSLSQIRHMIPIAVCLPLIHAFWRRGYATDCTVAYKVE